MIIIPTVNIADCHKKRYVFALPETSLDCLIDNNLNSYPDDSEYNLTVVRRT